MGLKNTLENKSAAFLESKLGDYINKMGKKVFVVSGADRWGMSISFIDAGYECAFGDLMFGLGVPVALLFWSLPGTVFFAYRAAAERAKIMATVSQLMRSVAGMNLYVIASGR